MFNNMISENLLDSSENNNLFVFFKLADKIYAIHTSHTIEVLKLPMLECPQRMPNFIVGLLNYNNITINVLNIKAVLNIPEKDFSLNDQVIVLKTDETIFAIIVDEVIDIKSIPLSEMQVPPYSSSDNLIKMLYHQNESMISILDLYAIEKFLIEPDSAQEAVECKFLFPYDENARNILKDRSKKLLQKNSVNLLPDIYNQDQFLLFTLDEVYYCINLKFVRELVDLKNIKITAIPFTPDFINGIINLRGDFIAIVNLKKFLNIEKPLSSISEKIIVFDSKDYKLAVIVDEIKSIISINNDKFIHKTVRRQESKYVMAEIVENEEIFNILNVEKILNDEKLFINIES